MILIWNILTRPFGQIWEIITSLSSFGDLRRNQPPIPEANLWPSPYHFGPLIRRIEELLK